MTSSTDTDFMAAALALAATHQGDTAENPSVGCVLVKDGRVVGSGVTGFGGRPHAETEAINAAGNAANGATAYVTLEPCAHHGQTPPCARALMDAGISRVVIAASDPDPRVDGGGMVMLQHAGIAIELLALPEAHVFYRGFFRRVRYGLPEVTVKAACSADFAMIRHSEPWITGPDARLDGQALRAEHQAILTGIGTVLADDPLLTCRTETLARRSPIRIVLDRQLRLPLDCKLVSTAESVPLWLLSHHGAIEQNASHATELREAGVVVHALDNPALPIKEVLAYLGTQGIHRLMVEAGPILTQALLDGGYADSLVLYQSPDILGADGAGALRLPPSHHMQARAALAPDTRTTYKLASCLPD